MVDISIMVVCYASDITEYGKRIPELSNATLDMKLETNSIETWTLESETSTYLLASFWIRQSPAFSVLKSRSTRYAVAASTAIVAA